MAADKTGLAALADATWRAIFERLATEPRAVGELAGQLPVSRPAVSQHLRVLKDAGLVVDERAGTRRLYSVDPDAVAVLRNYFDRLLTPQASVQESIVVEAPPEDAFASFTDIDGWWPADRHFLPGRQAKMTFEPRAGGHVYDRGGDGTVFRWARVLAFEPPSRVVLSWDVDTRWQHEQDPARTSEFEIRFGEETPGRTRIELEHRGLDRHGNGWQQLRDALGSPGGWAYGLSSLERHCRRR